MGSEFFWNELDIVVKSFGATIIFLGLLYVWLKVSGEIKKK